MSDEILINVTPPETRVAVVENGVLQEIYLERTRKRGLVGSIYKGRVCRVLPGMQAAFVEIGLERAGFLHASDVVQTGETEHSNANGGNILKLLHEGQSILVQIVKEPLGTKGARLSMQLSIPSRYQVYLPFSEKLSLSQQIEDEDERGRILHSMKVFQEQGYPGGYIARTAAEGIEDMQIRADMLFLNRLWESILETFKETTDYLVYRDLPLSERVLRDWYSSSVSRIRVDSNESFAQMQAFAQKFMPEVEARVEVYNSDRPLFDLYGIEEEIQKALERKVQLKSGGHLVIDQTEAMTTVDVNTGAYVSGRNLEQTIFKTNMEAAQATARQLRLRNLGGIVIIDFIDMHDAEHKRQVMRALEKSLDKDHAKYTISSVSELGLVEMTRKRTRESLEHLMCETCVTCGGRGTLKTPETTCFEIFREIMRDARQYDAQELLVLAANEVVEMLLDEESDSLAELEAFVGIRIRFRAESQYTQEQYDVVLV